MCFLVPNKPTFPLDKLRVLIFPASIKEMPHTYRIPHKNRENESIFIFLLMACFLADFSEKTVLLDSPVVPTQRPFGGLFPSIGIAWHQLRYIRRNPRRWQ